MQAKSPYPSKQSFNLANPNKSKKKGWWLGTLPYKGAGTKPAQ